MVVSYEHDYFIHCAFEQPHDLLLQMFLRTGGVQVVVLPLDNVSADISLRVTSSDPYLIKEMTAWLDFNESLLNDPSPYTQEFCVAPDGSEMCWQGTSAVVGGQGVTDLTITAEKKAVHLRRLLYVVIRVETNRDPAHEPLIQFLARQQGAFLPLRENHDEAIYSVDSLTPKFFSFEASTPGGYLVLTLGVDLRSVEAGESQDFKAIVQRAVESLSVFVQSCNSETFEKGMWSKTLRPSANLSTDRAFVNEYNQLITIVENNMHQFNSSICQYRIGVYSTSSTPVYFRLAASLQQQGSDLVLPLGHPVLGHLSRKPQKHFGAFGAEVQMRVADSFAIRVWKPHSKADQFILSVQACGGGVGFSWGTNRVRAREGAGASPWFLGNLKSVDRQLTPETLAKQGLLSRVIKGFDLSYIGASMEAAGRHRAQGFVGGGTSSFSLRVDPLDSAVCLGATNIDLQWRVRSGSWLPWLWGAPPKTMVADVWWSPLMVAPANDTIGKNSISTDWACAATAVASSGSPVPTGSVVYELFVVKRDKALGNWLASCGMYQDAYMVGVAEKTTIPDGNLQHSVTLDFDAETAYRIGLVAKYLTPGTTSLAQPFAYRFSDILPEVCSQQLQASGLSMALVLILVAVFVVLLYKYTRRRATFIEMFRGVLAADRMKRFARPGKSFFFCIP
ncbi:hypothetical protein ACSSS7_001672 [Eimeria intestinalis]